MTLNVMVPYGTIFKLWLYKKGASKQNCLNYEVSITNRVLTKDTKLLSSSGLRCEHLADLPASLNVDRYLGSEAQSDFEYLENFRIDQVSYNFNMKFTLEKETLVRFEGLQHKQIKFQLVLFKGKT